jgi:hypothetical protein
MPPQRRYRHSTRPHLPFNREIPFPHPPTSLFGYVLPKNNAWGYRLIAAGGFVKRLKSFNIPSSSQHVRMCFGWARAERIALPKFAPKAFSLARSTGAKLSQIPIGSTPAILGRGGCRLWLSWLQRSVAVVAQRIQEDNSTYRAAATAFGERWVNNSNAAQNDSPRRD